METAGGGGGGGRRRLLLDERPDSANLRDFLRIKDTDGGDLHSLSGLTLSAVLGTEKPPPPPTRTLLEIIRNDPNYTKDSKKTWRAFKDKIRLRRAGNAWTSTVPIPASDIPIQNRMVSRRNSTRFQQNPYPDSNSINVVGGDENRIELNSVSSSNDRVMMLRRNLSRVPTLSDSRYGQSGIDGSIRFNGAVVVDEGGGDEEEEAEEREGGGEEEEEELGGGEVVEAPGRMSLMALLAETDREMGLDGSGYMEEDEEEEEEEKSGSGGGGGEYNCCVCMVRHKGSAFIPCGHTFCRLCSRELWVQRGNCPLCNGYILEILDIF